MINLVNAILCLGKFLWKFRHSFICSTRVVPILQATLHQMVDGFVKQRGHFHHHPVSIQCVLALVKGGQMHLIIPSMITLTPLSILCDLQPRPPPTQFYLHSLQIASSISALAFLNFVAHSLQASMPSLKCYHHLS